MNRDPLPAGEESPPVVQAHSAAAAPEHIRLSGIAKRFGSFAALNSIELSVGRGELVCLLGPSGCGKTTLLRILAGLESADTGKVISFGEDITDRPPARRDYGIVFQSYALFPNLTVEKNIAFGLSGNLERQRMRVTELLELVGLAGFEQKYPAQLSGGQQQRVALARALATQPRLLLLDEPLSALDAQVRVHLRKQIRSLQQRLGVTTIMVTHDQEEALAMADRIVVMNHGGIEQIGTPEEIYSEPASAFVADFVGQANWLDARASGPGYVTLGQHRLSVAATSLLPDGTQLRLFIRPEDVLLHGRWNSSMAKDPNTSLAEPVSTELLGGVYRVTLRLLQWDNSHVQADINRRDFEMLHAVQGASIPVTLPPARLRIFSGRGALA